MTKPRDRYEAMITRCLATAVVSCTLLLASCQNLAYIARDVVPDTGHLVKGKTRYGEVLSEWGAPAFLAGSPHGFVMLYEDIRIGESGVKVKVPEAGNYGTASGRRRYAACVLMFDDDGVLQYVLSSQRDLETGGGVVIGAGSEQGGFIGVHDYGSGPSPFVWGMRGLVSIPELLNERWSRIETGQGGFELVDTPRTVGQHTLARPKPWPENAFSK